MENKEVFPRTSGNMRNIIIDSKTPEKQELLLHCSADHGSVFIILLWQGCFIACLGVCSFPFSEIVHHHDKVLSFSLLLKRIVPNLRKVVRLHFSISCILCYSWTCDRLQWCGSIYVKDQFSAGCCSPEEMALADQWWSALWPMGWYSPVGLAFWIARLGSSNQAKG